MRLYSSYSTSAQRCIVLGNLHSLHTNQRTNATSLRGREVEAAAAAEAAAGCPFDPFVYNVLSLLATTLGCQPHHSDHQIRSHTSTYYAPFISLSFKSRTAGRQRRRHQCWCWWCIITISATRHFKSKNNGLHSIYLNSFFVLCFIYALSA